MSHNANHCQLFSRINVSAQVHRNKLMLLELQQGGLQSSLHMLPHHREKIKKTKTNAASGQAHAWTAPALPPKASALAGREKALTVSPKVSASAPGEGGKTGFPPLKMMPRTTLCHSEIRATKAVKGYSQCSFQRRPRSLQQLITNTPAELEGAELRHKHFLICAFSKMENTPPDGKNVTTQEAAIWTGWQYHMTSYTSTTARQNNTTELNYTFPSHLPQLDRLFQSNTLLFCRSRPLLWPLCQNTVCNLSRLDTLQRKPPCCLPRAI